MSIDILPKCSLVGIADNVVLPRLCVVPAPMLDEVEQKASLLTRYIGDYDAHL
ncbi:MAG: hypothetical protein ACE5D4_01505 [Thermodesulfobacteriota bacterium]